MFKHYMTFLLMSAAATGVCTPKFIVDEITVDGVSMVGKTFTTKEEIETFGTAFTNSSLDLAPIKLTITNKSEKQIALLPSSISGSIVVNHDSILRSSESWVNSLSTTFASQLLGFLVTGYLFERGGFMLQQNCCGEKPCPVKVAIGSHLRTVGNLCYGSAGILSAIPLIKRFVQSQADAAQTRPQAQDILIEPGKSFTTYALVNKKELRNATTSSLNVVLKQNARSSHEASVFLTFQFSLVND